MGIFELFLIGIGLSMDAFAVAICKGLSMRKIDGRQTVTVALFFGGFQALMPVLGWALGKQFEQYITRYDHWIAFVLLLYIGGKMIWEALRGGEEDAAAANFSVKELLILQRMYQACFLLSNTELPIYEIAQKVGYNNLGFFYHSGKKPEIVAVVEVVREAYPDHTAQDPKNRHFDEKATPEDPRWYMVDVKLVRRLEHPLALEELRREDALEGMELLRRGSRLSVQPVKEEHFRHILAMAGLDLN